MQWHVVQLRSNLTIFYFIALVDTYELNTHDTQSFMTVTGAIILCIHMIAPMRIEVKVNSKSEQKHHNKPTQSAECFLL